MLLIVAVFAILLAYVLLVETRRAPDAGKQRPADKHRPADKRRPIEATPTPWPILSWEMDDLRSVQVMDGSKSTRLDRVGKEWRVTEPVDSAKPNSPADPRTIYLPLLELASLEARLLVYDEVTDKATYGLDDPTLTIEVETLSGEKARLYAGRETPDGTAFYLQREGDPRLYIVDHYKIELLQEWLSAPPFSKS